MINEVSENNLQRETVLKFVGSSENSEKWRQLENKFQKVTDALGKEIDPGIFETVVALNALGVNTAQSCEGHLDHGIAAPWVDIESSMTQQAREAINSADEHQHSPSEESSSRQQLGELATRQNNPEELRVEALGENLQLRRKLISYLDDFYQNRQSSSDTRLIVQGRALGTARLESQGGSLQVINDPQTKQQKLQEFQREMQSFGNFLKERFFG